MGLRPKTVPIPVDVREQYDALVAEVVGFALARCGNQALAEDVTQDAFAAAITAYQAGRTDAFRFSFLGLRRATSWSITGRRAQREEAKRVRATNVSSAPTSMSCSPRWRLPARRERVRAALGSLSLAERTALTFHDLDGLTVAELAQIFCRQRTRGRVAARACP